MENQERNYNGVTIEKTWTFAAFAAEFGTPKLAECKNSETGEVFNAIAFDKNGNVTFAHFGYSTQGMSAAELSKHHKEIKIGLNSNGKYTAYRQQNAWQEITLD